MALVLGDDAVGHGILGEGGATGEEAHESGNVGGFHREFLGERRREPPERSL
jgi:hypothetical protein